MSELRGRHEAVSEQMEMFGTPKVRFKGETRKVKVQIVTLEIRNAGDVREWYWDDVLDEDEVRLIGWTDTKKKVD